MDFDPRDYDSRDDDRFASDRDRGGKGNAHDDLDRNDDLRLPDSPSHDRGDDARDLGRGPGDSRQSNGDKHGHDPRDDARWPDRDRDPHDVFSRDLRRMTGRLQAVIGRAYSVCFDVIAHMVSSIQNMRRHRR